MIWTLSHRYDQKARVLADRHYSRRKAKIGNEQFAPPGRVLILYAETPGGRAYWISSWQEFSTHAWPGAWICNAFRNEGAGLSSDLILEAVACTRWKWPEVPELGMVTFVDAKKVRRKRDPGRCFIRAGFERCGTTKDRGLLAFQLTPEKMPEAEAPRGSQVGLFEGFG